MSSGLDSLTIDNEFTPSTPYVHKFRTELCKSFEMYGKCKFGDEVSIKISDIRTVYFYSTSLELNMNYFLYFLHKVEVFELNLEIYA